jgi:hypothetical protein
MFNFLIDSVENALNVAQKTINYVVDDEPLPSKQEVSKLIADGLTIYAAAEVLDIGVDVIQGIMGE